MTHTPHELAADFPEKAERIHALRETDAHFRKLSDEYHELNRAVHRAETLAEPTDQSHEAEMRKRRVHLKDQIIAILNAS